MNFSNFFFCSFLRIGKKIIYFPHRVGRVLSFCSSRRNWDSTTPPSPAGECALPLPLLPGGGAHSLAREGVGESQFRRGDTHCNSLRMWLLCNFRPLQYCLIFSYTLFLALSSVSCSITAKGSSRRYSFLIGGHHLGLFAVGVMASEAGVLTDRVLQPGGGHTGGFGLTLLQAFPDKKNNVGLRPSWTWRYYLMKKDVKRSQKWYQPIGLATSYLRRAFSQILKGHVLWKVLKNPDSCPLLKPRIV
jgi:hypothetical protein